MMTKRQYIEYLISTSVNYTCTNLAEHLDGLRHDAVSDYLQRETLTARSLWERVQALLNDGPQSYLIVDDSVQNKQYSRKIELVKKQYSGAAHGLVRGIGVVNLVHSDGSDFYPIDYRIYAPDVDGKTKNDHFGEMLQQAKQVKRLQAQTILFDSWYASVDNLKLIVGLDMFFVTTLKANRLVSLTPEGGYIHLQDLAWTPDALQHGLSVKLKEVPFRVQLFKVVAPHGDIEWVITNHPSGTFTTSDIQHENAVRWQIEQLHRELKQLTGSEKCECRKARSQRTHLACCYLAWLSLKVKAQQWGKTLYAAQRDLFSDYLRAELRQPHIPAFLDA
jgi:Transposase DDE domain